MTKKLIVGGLVLALCVALVGPAAAKGKKKKGPKPYRSPDVTLLVAHPVFNGNSGTVVGVTAQEFINRCAIPASNGFDAYVFEVPPEYQKIEAVVSAFGTAGPAGYDLDLYLFDESCALTIAYNSTNADEIGTSFKGTAFILLHNYLADPAVTAHIELKPA